MLKPTKLIAYFAAILWCGSVHAGFMALSSGYDFFATDAMNSNNAQMIGPQFQIEVGGNTRSMIASIFIRKSDTKGNVLHDDNKHVVAHDITTLGFKASFMITRTTYGIVGFAMNRHSSSLSGVSDYDKAAIYKAYDLEDSQNSDGMFFGIGRNFTRGRNSSFYGEYILNDISSGPKGKNHSLILGWRFKVNLNI